jgi:RNA-directed DNA polymerase
MPMPWVWTEGNTRKGAMREPWSDPARSETLSMSGSCLRRSWEVSSVPDGVLSGGAGKGNRNPAIYAGEKSDTSILSKKLPNKARPAEEVEKRGVAKGSVVEFPICRTQSRNTCVDEIQRST